MNFGNNILQVNTHRCLIFDMIVIL